VYEVDAYFGGKSDFARNLELSLPVEGQETTLISIRSEPGQKLRITTTATQGDSVMLKIVGIGTAILRGTRQQFVFSADSSGLTAIELVSQVDHQVTVDLLVEQWVEEADNPIAPENAIGEPCTEHGECDSLPDGFCHPVSQLCTMRCDGLCPGARTFCVESYGLGICVPTAGPWNEDCESLGAPTGDWLFLGRQACVRYTPFGTDCDTLLGDYYLQRGTRGYREVARYGGASEAHADVCEPQRERYVCGSMPDTPEETIAQCTGRCSTTYVPTLPYRTSYCAGGGE
jgi:hypothetical protein